MRLTAHHRAPAIEARSELNAVPTGRVTCFPTLTFASPQVGCVPGRAGELVVRATEGTGGQNLERKDPELVPPGLPRVWTLCWTVSSVPIGNWYSITGVGTGVFVDFYPDRAVVTCSGSATQRA